MRTVMNGGSKIIVLPLLDDKKANLIGFISKEYMDSGMYTTQMVKEMLKNAEIIIFTNKKKGFNTNSITLSKRTE